MLVVADAVVAEALEDVAVEHYFVVVLVFAPVAVVGA